ncbi:hypothetical protein [Actinoplanes sp. L3-i22]|uniref:hypothetical protein n=1 Tax=Actinoplanes sp. L3-i22 TaxID=2836373 RepID=UPI001C752406|nr:hypothetical protein [Actinoplanes sp. L3-i22]BCY05390.1 hypothetical protein L3i22_004780 [Actinoplanes sp. L3-i22]
MPSDFDLLRPLDTEPRSPSSVDIQLAIATARRKRAIRTAGYAGAATLTVTAVVAGGLLFDTSRATTPTQPAASKTAATKAAPAVKAPTSCTIEALPVPHGALQALVASGDPTGKYFVGRSYPKAGGYQAIMWHDGVSVEVPLPGDLEESLTDVNSTGTAVGWSLIGEGTSMPYVYSDGKVTKLPGTGSAATAAINNKGAIVGDDGAYPLLWTSKTATPRRLPMPEGSQTGTAVDIAEDGTVIGTLDNKVPYVWLPDGSHHALDLPDLGGGKQVEGRLFHIRGDWVTGVVNEAGSGKAAGLKRAQGEVHAVRWNLRTGKSELIDQLDKSADALNAQGWLTGISKQGGATLLAGNTLVPLPGLAPPNPQDGLADIANTISDNGQTIGGQSNDASTAIQPVLWHCK